MFDEEVSIRGIEVDILNENIEEIRVGVEDGILGMALRHLF
ncbi:hypothetical protein [Clostridium sp. CS001]|nr:hypothetical protein [Clostridium sp. CS001]